MPQHLTLYSVTGRTIEMPLDSSMVTIADLTKVLVKDHGYEAGVKVVYRGEVMDLNEKIAKMEDTAKHKIVITGALRQDVYLPTSEEEAILEGVLMDVSSGESVLEGLLRAYPGFDDMRREVVGNPSLMAVRMHQMQQTHPEVVEAIKNDQQGFLDALKYGLPQEVTEEDDAHDETHVDDEDEGLQEAALGAVLLEILGGNNELEAFITDKADSIDPLRARYTEGTIALDEFAASVISLYENELQPLIDRHGLDNLLACLQRGPPAVDVDPETLEMIGEGGDEEVQGASFDYEPCQADVQTLISLTGAERDEAYHALEACQGDIEAAVAFLLD